MDIAPTESGGGAAGAIAGNRFSELTSEEFVRIITTELSNQDPLEPSDTSALIQQFSDLRSIQADLDMGKRLESLVLQNELASASNLIGRTVSGVDENNERVAGVVRSVTRTEEGPVVTTEAGERIAFGNVDIIVEPVKAADGEGVTP